MRHGWENGATWWTERQGSSACPLLLLALGSGGSSELLLESREPRTR